MLRDAHINAIYVSEFIRTQQTARPVANLLHISAQKFSGATTSSLVDALRRLGSGTALVVGHSNTIPSIITTLGGPPVTIAETEFDNLFVLNIGSTAASLLRLRYGSNPASPESSAPENAAMLKERSRVMRVDFVKSGGYTGMIGRVAGTINFQNDHADVSSGNNYKRQLAPEEGSRARVDPAELEQFANEMRTRTSRSADLDHYHVTMTTEDGKTHNIDFNSSGASNELQGLPTGAVSFVRWLREESTKIRNATK